MQGGGTSERLNVAPVMVGTGVRLGHMLSLLLDQHSWGTGYECAWSQGCNWIEQTDSAKKSTVIPYPGWDRVAGGWRSEYVDL